MPPAAPRRRARLLGAAGAGALIAGLAAIPASADHHRGDGEGQRSAPHVLLLSIDGMHQSDLDWYVKTHPGSVLAALTEKGASFTNAQTPFPSDSYPGIVAQLTGGNPSSTGVYYDDTWNHELLPAGTTTTSTPSCSTAKPGVEVTYMEAAARNPKALDSGQGLFNNGYEPPKDNILNLTGNATSLLDPAALPVDPTTCSPVYPHSYVRVNTVFEVARAARLRTAWSDKHAAYEVLNGPSGRGVQDLFTPEINSLAPNPGAKIDWTGDNSLTMQYDSYKVQSILNEIDGYDHSRSTRQGTPAIFGMNFQTVSTAQKLPCSPPNPRPCSPGSLPGGYERDGVTPGPLLQRALDYINTQVGAMQHELAVRHLSKSTTIILSAKHGQSPQNPAALTRIPDGPIIDKINADWQANHPETPKLITFSVNDDGMLIWLDDQVWHQGAHPRQVAADFVKQQLWAMNASATDPTTHGNDINGAPKGYTHAGLRRVLAGVEAANFMHAAFGDARVPDVLGIARYGTVYSGGMKKIAEHGGDNPQDRNVPLVVSGGPIAAGQTFGTAVETTQIAPTILTLLGLDPNALQAVQIEHTATLPVATNASSGGDGQGDGGQQGGGDGQGGGSGHHHRGG